MNEIHTDKTDENFKPLFSVIIPFYNSSDTIERAILSVLNQTEQRLELIIIDDCSSTKDRTALISICNILCNSRKIKINSTRSNMGPGAARNIGMRMAIGQYIAFLDADDFWRPEHLQAALSVLSQAPAEAIVSHVPLRLNQNKLKQTKSSTNITAPSFRQLNSIEFVLVQRNYSTITIAFSRTLLATSGFFPEDRKHCEDLEFYLRLYFTGAPWFKITDPRTAVVGKPLVGSSVGLSSHTKLMYQGSLKALHNGLKGTKYQNVTELIKVLFHFKFIVRIFRIIVARI